MLKKIVNISLVIGLICGLFSLSALAGKKPKTGEVKNQKYTDFRFGFSVEFPKDWKTAKVKKEYTPQRIIIEQKKPGIPVKLRNAPEYALKPLMMVFADTSDMTPAQFFTFLQADTGKSKLKKKILEKSVLLEKSTSFRLRVLSTVNETVLGKSAQKIKARLAYDARIELPERGDAGRDAMMIKDFRTGYIYIIPFEGWLLYIEQVGEDQYIQELTEVFDKMIASMEFINTESDVKTQPEVEEKE